jgi:hypothetical protein
MLLENFDRYNQIAMITKIAQLQGFFFFASSFELNLNENNKSDGKKIKISSKSLKIAEASSYLFS